MQLIVPRRPWAARRWLKPWELGLTIRMPLTIGPIRVADVHITVGIEYSRTSFYIQILVERVVTATMPHCPADEAFPLGGTILDF